ADRASNNKYSSNVPSTGNTRATSRRLRRLRRLENRLRQMDRVSPKDKKRRRRPVKRQQATTRESKSLNMTTKKKSYHHLTVNVIMAGKKYLALVDSGAQDNYI